MGHFNPRGISLLHKSVRDFFRTKGFLRILDGFFFQTKEFLPKAYEIFWSEMPLASTFGFVFSAHGGRVESPSLPSGI